MFFTFGTSFDTEGPGLSARIICILCPPPRGRNAIIKTRTPMPPTQWVKQRHILMDFGNDSTAAKMLDPVVVKPETDSKSASIKELVAPVKRKGSAPKRLKTIQLSATITKPSRAYSAVLLGFLYVNSTPTPQDISITKRKPKAALSR